MKKYLFILILFTGFNAFSQVSFPPCEAFDTTGKGLLKTKTSHSNTLYLGVDNIIEINKDQIQVDSFFVKVENGHLFKESKFKYLLIPSKIGVSKIRIFSKKDSSIIFSSELKVIKLPKPYIVLNKLKIMDTVAISKDAFMISNSFNVELSPDLIMEDEFYTINDFSMGYKYGSVYMRKNTIGNILTVEMQSIIKKMKPGQEIDFQFYLKSEGDLIQSLPPIKVIIK